METSWRQFRFGQRCLFWLSYEYPNNHIFHTLIVATTLKVFGLNPFLLRMPVLLCGIASLALAFFTTYRITRNAQAGIAVSLLLAVSGGAYFLFDSCTGIHVDPPHRAIHLPSIDCVGRWIGAFTDSRGRIFLHQGIIDIRRTHDGGYMDSPHVRYVRKIAGNIFLMRTFFV